jgi:cathepsin B
MSQCNNCNIQNSSSEYAGNGDLSKNKIKPPRRRYNPGLTNKAGSTGDSSVSKSLDKLKTLNISTLKAVEKVVSVDTQVRATDEINQKKMRAKSQIVFNQDDNQKKSLNLNMMRLINRSSTSVDTSSQMSTNKVDTKKSIRRFGNKSAGTALASSALYKAQFSQLKPIIVKQQNVLEPKLPLNFDGRKVWRKFFKPIRNQGLCGSCWAFASLFVLQTRLAIYSNGEYNYSLSPAKLVFCNTNSVLNHLDDKNDDVTNEINSIKKFLKSNNFDYIKDGTSNKEIKNFSCNGETLISSWQFLYRYGVPEDDCIPYGDTEDITELNLTIKDEVTEDICEQMLGNRYDTCKGKNIPMISHKAGGYYFVKGVAPEGNEYNIRKDIYRWGPTTTGMMVYEDFINWSGKGVYKWDGKSEKYGGHAVVIVGWGETETEKYWIVRNSWGNSWGDEGYFKILRGENHCEIEENVFTGIPNIPSLRYFIEQPLYFQQEDHIYKYLWGIYDSGLKRTTLEQIALGKLQPGTLTFKDIYDIRKFPNFQNFVAGITSYESFYLINPLRRSKFLLLIIFFILFFLVFL